MSNYPDFNYDNNYGRPMGNGDVSALGNVVSSVMKRVYVKMTFGLLVTAIVSLFCANQGFLTYMANNSWLMWVLIFAEFGIVFGLSAGIQKMSSAAATALFYIFAVINGLMLSSIFVVYSPDSIAKTFFITAGTFAAMSVYGYSTDRDLTKMGSILFMALIGLIIATLVNMFMHSSGLAWVISIAGVLIFVGLTAWDTQQIKRMAAAAPGEYVGRLATLGALSLYLDFVNLFLYLLRFFGNSRN